MKRRILLFGSVLVIGILILSSFTKIASSNSFESNRIIHHLRDNIENRNIIHFNKAASLRFPILKLYFLIAFISSIPWMLYEATQYPFLEGIAIGLWAGLIWPITGLLLLFVFIMAITVGPFSL